MKTNEQQSKLNFDQNIAQRLSLSTSNDRIAYILGRTTRPLIVNTAASLFGSENPSKTKKNEYQDQGINEVIRINQTPASESFKDYITEGECAILFNIFQDEKEKYLPQICKEILEEQRRPSRDIERDGRSKASDMANRMKDNIHSKTDEIGERFRESHDRVSEATDRAEQDVKSKVNETKNNMTEMKDTAKDKTKQMKDKVVSKVIEIKDHIKDTSKAKANEATDAMKNLQNKTSETVSTVYDTIQSKASETTDRIKEGTRSTLNEVTLKECEILYGGLKRLSINTDKYLPQTCHRLLQENSDLHSTNYKK